MTSPESPDPTPAPNPSDPLSTGEHKALGGQGRRELILAFDRLVSPLERILAHMYEHSRRQRRIEWMLAVAIVILVGAGANQVRLTARLVAMEHRLATVSDVANSTESKVSATERKVDEVKVAASSAASAAASAAASQVLSKAPK